MLGPEGFPCLCAIDVQGREVFISIHAGIRWSQRVRLDGHQGRGVMRADIEALAPVAYWQMTPPDWYVPGEEEYETEAWIMFGNDVTMPVSNDVARTTLTRGHLHEAARERRNRHRAGVRAAKRAAAKSSGVGRDFGDKRRVGVRRARRAKLAA